MRLTKKQKEILDKYNISYEVDNVNDLLINIDYVMTDYLDEKDEPTDNFRELEKLYDEIYDDNYNINL